MVSKSPSPSTLRAQSPNSRTPDPSCTHKKAPWVNPLGSARHPIHSNLQDSQQREPISRGRSIHKENEARGRSPVAPCIKGSKSFMAPTISASSKRRVLSERNDTVRSSFTSSCSSLTDSVDSLGSSFDFDARPNIELVPQDDLDLVRSVRSWDPVMVSGELHVLEPVSASPTAAPNTSLPPYDPETNFLSPRPRFLHYKPKPRADPENGRILGDSFSSESFEESPQISDDAQSSLTRKSLEVEDEDEEVAEEVNSEEKVPAGANEKPKARSSTRTKLVTLLVLMTFFCFCFTISDTPVVPSLPATSPNWGISNLAQTLGQSRDTGVVGYLSPNLKDFLKLFELWSTHSQFQERGELFKNISSVLDKDADIIIAEPVDEPFASLSKVDEKIREEESGTETNEDGDYGEDRSQLVPEASVEIVVEKESRVVIAEIEIQSIYDSEPLNIVPEKKDAEIEGITEVAVESEVVEEQVLESYTEVFTNTDTDESNSGICTEELDKDQPSSVESDLLSETHSVLTEEQEDGFGSERSTDAPGSNLNYPLAITVSCLAIAFTAAILSLHCKQNRTPPPSVPEVIPKPPVSSVVPDSTPPYSNIQQTQYVETLHESGPAASSSLHNTSLRSTKTPRKVEEEEEDVLSQERKLRRDSTASSTSFGSFTTYEKRSAKKVGQDEVITPVRRSSRIRNQVVSP